MAMPRRASEPSNGVDRAHQLSALSLHLLHWRLTVDVSPPAAAGITSPGAAGASATPAEPSWLQGKNLGAVGLPERHFAGMHGIELPAGMAFTLTQADEFLTRLAEENRDRIAFPEMAVSTRQQPASGAIALSWGKRHRAGPVSLVRCTPLVPRVSGTYCLFFGSAARWARLAIQASYSGVPLLGGNPWGSPPNQVGNVSAAVSPIVRLPVAHDISGKHAPKRTSLRISFTMAELYTLRFQSPHCRTTFVAALHSLTVMIPQRRIDGPDRVRQCASLLGLAMVRGSQDHRLSSRRSHACCVGEALPILIIYALLSPDLWGAKSATNS